MFVGRSTSSSDMILDQYRAFGPHVIVENDPLPGITLGLLDIFLSIDSFSLDSPKHLENFLSILSFPLPLRIFF